MAVSERAIIARDVRLGSDVDIGPFSVIEGKTEIGDRTIIAPHTVICRGTKIGSDCVIGPGAILGSPPSDFHYRGEDSGVNIGNRTQVREYVTIHRSTGAGTQTEMGDDCLIMAYVHIGHNCRIGSRVTIVNATQLAGHVEVMDNAFIGGLCGVHQFTRVGSCAMLGACSYLSQDLLPFMLAAGNPCQVRSTNRVGLTRLGNQEILTFARLAFRMIFRSNLGLSQAIAEIRRKTGDSRPLALLTDFIGSSRRGILLRTPGNKHAASATSPRPDTAIQTP